MSAPAPSSLRTVQVSLACCALEVAAARAGAKAAPAAEEEAPPVLVVAGTVTDAMAELVRAEYREAAQAAEQQGQRLRVISFGSCASTGGPYWDSYAVTKGVDQLVPVDLCVPGCPPRPEALAEALAQLDGADLTGADVDGEAS